MKFLVDMNLSPAWVRVLSDAGFEAVHWTSVGPTNASDRDVMQWAAEHRCIVLTCDLDFGALLAVTQRREPSVVQIRSDRLAPGAIGSTVLAAIRHCAVDLQSGALLSIDAGRGRLRVLPLPPAST
jgi:predicted nuclease of predicted toxin-antitoxin system